MPEETNVEVVVASTPGAGEISTPDADQAAFDKAFEEKAGPAEGVAEVSAAEAVIPDGKPAPAVADDKTKVEAKPEIPDPNADKVEYDKQVQRLKSWEGRIKKTEADLKAKEEELRAREQAPPATKPGETAPAPRKLGITTDDEGLIEKFTKEMGPEFVKPFDALMRKTILEFARPLAQEIISLRKQLGTTTVTATQAASSVEDAHYNTILEVHPDAEVVLDKEKPVNVYTWIETLPMKEAVKAQAVLEKGNAKQVIKLFTEFKEKNGLQKPATPSAKDITQTPAPDSRVAAATAVKGGGAFIPKTKADKNDFEGAFAEAITVK
jgi:hypothetical protein